MAATLGKFIAVAEFEADTLQALDLVEALHRRASIGGSTYADYIAQAYKALCDARYEVDSWKEAAVTREP